MNPRDRDNPDDPRRAEFWNGEIYNFICELRHDVDRSEWHTQDQLKKVFGKCRNNLLDFYEDLRLAYRCHGYDSGIVGKLPDPYTTTLATWGRRFAASMFELRDEFLVELKSRRQPDPPKVVDSVFQWETEIVQPDPPKWDVEVVNPPDPPPPAPTLDRRDLIPVLQKIEPGGHVLIKNLEREEQRRLMSSLKWMTRDAGWNIGIDGERLRSYRSRRLKSGALRIERLTSPVPRKKYARKP